MLLTTRVISLFCKCGSMMFPKDGKYVCPKCNEVREIKKEDKETFTMHSTSKDETAVVTDEVATLPKTRILCPKCGYSEAYYTIRQTRSADEPETMIYRCCKCNHSWREY